MSIHVQSNVWRSCPQKRDRLLLMIALADFCNDEGLCWPSLKTLAKRVRGTRRGVQRMLDALIAEDEIELVSDGGGRGNPAKYLLERYSEGGVLTSFEKGDPEHTKGDPGANKGRNRLGQSVPEHHDPSENRQSGVGFVNIYDAYPRKVGRPAALRAILKALKTTPAEKLLELTQAYAKAVAGSDPQFIPHPATWFNQERYNDDPKTWTRSDRRDRTESSRNVGTANQGKSSQYAGVGKVRPIHRPEG